ncbi:DUF86 domain-containing protein [Candidatus Poribacteria bacterium]|nr:DUF86 domain-containing protein [Candidatus Poribacteria bacterium]
MTRHDPLVAIRHMLDHAREAVEITRPHRREDMDTDRLLNLAVVRLLEVIGEAARRVPDELRRGFPRIPWQDISDLRNRLIHGYDMTNFDTMWTIIEDELPPLISELEAMLSGKS